MWVGQFLLVLGGFAALLSLTRASVSFAPWVPSHAGAVRDGLRLAQLQPGEALWDLGCGDGRVLTVAAADFGARATGVELSWPVALACWLRLLLARPRLRRLGAPQPRLRWGSLFRVSVAPADVVFLYGVSGTLGGALLTKFARDLRPGTRILSYGFPLPGLRPTAIRDGATGQVTVPTAVPAPARPGLTGPQTLYLYSW